MTVQEPAPSIDRLLPLTEQVEGVMEKKFTARPEVAVAVIVKDETPKVTSLSAAKVIVCDA